jgi:acyl carrier protein
VTLNIKQQTREFIQSNFMMGGVADFPDDASFMDLRILDSTGFLELISFVERTFDIRLSDSDMVPENLDSLDGIERFVEEKSAGRPEVER